MKKSLLSLGSVLFLAACSGGGSGNGTGFGGTNPGKPDINPLARPSNPAPMSYLQSMFAMTKNSEKYIPEDITIFDEVFYGDYISKKQDNDQNEKQALAKLAPEGLKYRERILAGCNRSKVQVVEVSKASENPKAGEVSSKRLGQTSLGTSCEYIAMKTASVTKTYLDGHGYNPETKVSVSKYNEVQEESESVEIRNAQIVAASGQKSRKSTSRSESSQESSYSAEGSSYTSTRTSSGTFESVMANGHVIKGTNLGYSTSTQSRSAKGEESYVSESIHQTKATTPRGDIWMTYIYKKGDVREVYLNGQKISEEDLARLGMGK